MRFLQMSIGSMKMLAHTVEIGGRDMVVHRFRQELRPSSVRGRHGQIFCLIGLMVARVALLRS